MQFIVFLLFIHIGHCFSGNPLLGLRTWIAIGIAILFFITTILCLIYIVRLRREQKRKPDGKVVFVNISPSNPNEAIPSAQQGEIVLRVSTSAGRGSCGNTGVEVTTSAADSGDDHLYSDVK